MFTFRRTVGSTGQEFVDRFVPFAGDLYVYEDNPNNSAFIAGSNLATVQQPFISSLSSTGTGGTLVASLNGAGQPVSWQVPGNAVSADSGPAGFTVGAIANDAQTWNGLIAEVLVYDHVLTGGELNGVGSYLADKYGIESSFVPEPSGGMLLGAAGLWWCRRRRPAETRP
jgi:hypothetical protein